MTDKNQGIRKIAVSEEVFSKLPEGFAENLEQNEKVILVPYPKEEIHALKLKALAGMMCLVLSGTSNSKDSLSQEDLEKMQKNFEIRKLEPVDMGVFDEHQEKQHKAKMHVPHTIGKPNSRKKGGR